MIITYINAHILSCMLYAAVAVCVCVFHRKKYLYGTCVVCGERNPFHCSEYICSYAAELVI